MANKTYTMSRCKYITSLDIQKTRLKKLVTHAESHASAIRLLEIKSIINNNNVTDTRTSVPFRFGFLFFFFSFLPPFLQKL